MSACTDAEVNILTDLRGGKLQACHCPVAGEQDMMLQQLLSLPLMRAHHA
jgi:hypothetical protein